MGLVWSGARGVQLGLGPWAAVGFFSVTGYPLPVTPAGAVAACCSASYPLFVPAASGWRPGARSRVRRAPRVLVLVLVLVLAASSPVGPRGVCVVCGVWNKRQATRRARARRPAARGGGAGRGRAAGGRHVVAREEIRQRADHAGDAEMATADGEAATTPGKW
jgi:hypothetical protein